MSTFYDLKALKEKKKKTHLGNCLDQVGFGHVCGRIGSVMEEDPAYGGQYHFPARAS